MDSHFTNAGRVEAGEKFLEEFPVYDDDSVVPNDSIIREFIGGSTYAAADPETGKKTFVGGNWFWRNLQNYFKDKHEELKEKREEFIEKHEDTKKEIMGMCDELIDNLEDAAKDDVESVSRGEGDTVVK